jgi:hypothetical protein
VSKLYIDPLSAIKIRDALKESNTKGDFAYLHLISSLPDMRRLYLNKSDYKILDDQAEKRKHSLIYRIMKRTMSGFYVKSKQQACSMTG